MSTLKVNTITNIVGGPPDIPGFESGSSDGSGASAWGNVSSNGTLNGGLNIASVTKTDTGKYDVVFTTPMPSSTYSVVGGSLDLDNSTNNYYNLSATGFSVVTQEGSYVDQDFCFAVFATNALPPKGGTGTDAWATVDITTVNGSCNVPASFNVASVTRTGTGIYDVVFTTPMPTGSYAVTTAPIDSSVVVRIESYTTTGFTAVTRVAADNSSIDAGFNLTVNATNAVLPASFSEDQIQSVVDLAQSGVTNPGASAWGNISVDGVLNDGLNSTVTYIGTGSYAVTFVTPMPNADYSVNATTIYEAQSQGGSCYVTNQTATGFQIDTFTYTGTVNDYGVSYSVFATNALPLKGGTGTDSWATVDKTTINGACNVPASFNVASVTRTSTGKYSVAFTTPMPTANYSIQLSTDMVPRAHIVNFINATASGFDVYLTDNNSGFEDSDWSFTVNATNATLPLTVTTEQIESAINNPGASAWGRFESDGTLTNGSNVSSVTRSSEGVYSVVFTTPMPNANYAVTSTNNTNNTRYVRVANITPTGFQLVSSNTSTGNASDGGCGFTVFATNALPPKGGTGIDSWGNVQSDGTLNASFNVDSVTKTGTGVYVVSFLTAMPSSEYAITLGGTSNNTTYSAQTASGFQVEVLDNSLSPNDFAFSFSVNATNATLPTTFTEAQIQSVIDAQPQGIAKAWVNFDGNNSPIVIRSSLNVSSITDNGTGQYTANFSTPMPDSNYAFSASRNRNSNDAAITITGKTSSSISVRTVSETFQGLDVSECSIIVFSS